MPTPKRRYNLGPRVDYQLTPTNTLSVRYQYYRDDFKNDGVGGFSLQTQGFNLLSTEHTLQVSDTQTLGANVVNETRFQYLHQTSSQDPLNTATTLLVQGAFNGGGSNEGTILDTSNRYELQNYTSISHGTHLIKFGMRLRGITDSNFSTTGFNGEYIFPSIQAYQAALATGAQNASQFLLTAGPTAGMPGNPLASVGQVDVGLYAEDDWRIRPNITLSYGLRFESQNDISNHANWAPRLGFAWGLGGGGKAAPKTVLRAGFGIFYDRFNSSYVLQEDRLNGIRQAQFIFTNPDFFPNTVPTSTVSPSVYAQASHLRAPYVMQTAVSLERQVTKFANVSLSYLNSRGWDQLFTNNINSPEPGTFDFPFYTSPTPGVRPIAGFENVYQFQSEGIYRENQMFLQATIRAGAKLTLFSYYTLTYANSDTSAATAFPSNPRNIMQDYGRSPFDIRNRYFLGGTIGLPHNFRLSPFMIVSSGTPFNITLSQDLIGTAQFNQRPTFANGAIRPHDRHRARNRIVQHSTLAERHADPGRFPDEPLKVHPERPPQQNIWLRQRIRLRRATNCLGRTRGRWRWRRRQRRGRWRRRARRRAVRGRSWRIWRRGHESPLQRHAQRECTQSLQLHKCRHPEWRIKSADSRCTAGLGISVLQRAKSPRWRPILRSIGEPADLPASGFQLLGPKQNAILRPFPECA